MVVWDGLYPIPSQVVVDTLALTGFSYAAWTNPTIGNSVVLLSSCFLGIGLSGGNMTNRWPMTFPLVIFVLIQILRRCFSNKWISKAITSLGVLLVLFMAALLVLFPAVELPPFINAKFNTGVADIFFPVHPNVIRETSFVSQDHVSVRILYPTLDEPGVIPHLKPETAEAFCEETMKHQAPPGIQSFFWFLHTWRLTKVKAKRNSKPIDGPSPIVVFSPGLGGNTELYTYQTLALAAQGYVVAAIDHTDGAAPVVKRKDGSIMRYNASIMEVRFPKGWTVCLS